MELGYLLNFGEALMQDVSVSLCLCENQERAKKAVPRSGQPTNNQRAPRVIFLPTIFLSARLLPPPPKFTVTEP
jgi:hypothetical protein